MDRGNFKDSFLTREGYEDWLLRLDRKVSTFSYSFMNNSKWQKLFITICENNKIIKRCEIYDFFGSCTNEIIFSKIYINYMDHIFPTYIDNFFTTSEHKTSYKEIEFIEFLKYWNNEPVGRLVKPTKETQDTCAIKSSLDRVGQFQWDESEKHLRIIGYR
ncbi:DUF6678 family protein [Hymenobacter lapidiphilus]|uniref:DUF6678 family protein n=1 Tax=Hymenobacter sp. CCM 8763 TaxID=2303334 RepID=UPI0039776AC7